MYDGSGGRSVTANGKIYKNQDILSNLTYFG